MECAKEVCAVFDMQGFYANKIFYPREFAIANDEIKICLEIDSEIPDDIKISSFRHFSFQQHQLHGIPVKKVLDTETLRVLKISQLKEIIFEIYCRIRTDDKPLVAIKNHQMSSILEESCIPYINLESNIIGGEICPPLSMFDKINGSSNYHCLLHYILHKNSFKNGHRCALRKSVYIWKWLKQKIISDSLIYDLLKEKF